MNHNETPKHDSNLEAATEFLDIMFDRLTEAEIAGILALIDPNEILGCFNRAEVLSLAYQMANYGAMAKRSELNAIYG